MKNYAVILAAGKGTRMKTNTPKCAVELFGKPLVKYLIDSVRACNINDVILVVGHGKEIVQSVVGDDVKYATQTQQLGTAHAVACAKDFVTNKMGNVLILFGDAPLVDEEIINGIFAEHNKCKNDITIATMMLDNPFGYGRIVKEKSGNVIKIVEQTDATKTEQKIKEVNSGVMVAKAKVLFDGIAKIDNNNAKHEYYLTDIVKVLGKTRKIGTYIVDNAYKMRGVNDLVQLSQIQEYLQQTINQKHMLNGVMFENSKSTIIGPDVTISSGAYIRSGSVILGKSIIASGAVIGPNSELKDAVVDENAKVIHSMIYDSHICAGANVGPFAHVRMNSTIGENNRIGNFVEIKNSTIGMRTNLSHLAYMGDTTCGSGVNFGCGCITVNYDGKNKHKTNIGDNVFIGCNSNLMAPLTIESNSFIAAGSTVTESLNNGDFAIARSRQTTKHDYAKKYGYKKV